METLVVVLCVLFMSLVSAQEECPNLIDLAPSWEEGLDGSLPIKIDHEVDAWTVVLDFDAAFTEFTCWVGEVSTTGSTHVEISNYNWDGDLNVGDVLDLHFQMKFNGNAERPQLISATFNGEDVCGGAPSKSTTQKITTQSHPSTTPEKPVTTTNPTTTSSPNSCNDVVTEESSGTGNWHGLVVLSPDEDIKGWYLKFTFTEEVDFIESPLADVTGNGMTWTLTSRLFDEEIPAGGSLEIKFIVDYSGVKPAISEVGFNGEIMCGDGEPVTTPEPITTSSPNSCDDVIIEESAGTENWHGLVVLSTNEDVNGWMLELTFTEDVDFIESPLADVTGNGKTWTLTSRLFDDDIPAGGTLEVRFIVDYSGSKPSISEVIFNGRKLCGDGSPATTPEPITTSSPISCDDVVIEEAAETGNWHGLIILSPDENVNGWTLELAFTDDVYFIESPLAGVTGNGKKWTLTSRSFDDEIPAGGTLEVRFIVDYTEGKPAVSEVIFNGKILCGDENPITTPEPITTSSPNSCDDIVIEESALTGNWHGLVVLSPEEDVNGWTLKLAFTEEVDFIESPLADVTGNGKIWTLTSRSFDDEIPAGGTLEVRFIVDYSGGKPAISEVVFNGKTLCDDEKPVTTPQPITTSSPNSCDDFVIEESAGMGNWHGLIHLSPKEDVNGWTLKLVFTEEVDFIESPLADVTGNGKTWTLTSRSFDDEIPAGGTLEVRFIVDYSEGKPAISEAIFNGQTLCGNENTSPGPKTTTMHPRTTQAPGDCDNVIHIESQTTNSWTGSIYLAPSVDIPSWTVLLSFDANVLLISTPLADVTGHGSTWTLTSKNWDGGIDAGDSLCLTFEADFLPGDRPKLISIKFNGDELCQSNDGATDYNAGTHRLLTSLF